MEVYLFLFKKSPDENTVIFEVWLLLVLRANLLPLLNLLQRQLQLALQHGYWKRKRLMRLRLWEFLLVMIPEYLHKCYRCIFLVPFIWYYEFFLVYSELARFLLVFLEYICCLFCWQLASWCTLVVLGLNHQWPHASWQHNTDSYKHNNSNHVNHTSSWFCSAYFLCVG